LELKAEEPMHNQDPPLYKEEEVKDWLKFQFYYYSKNDKFKNPPEHIILYYFEKLKNEELTYDQVRQEVQYLVNPSLNQLQEVLAQKNQKDSSTIVSSTSTPLYTLSTQSKISGADSLHSPSAPELDVTEIQPNSNLTGLSFTSSVPTSIYPSLDFSAFNSNQNSPLQKQPQQPQPQQLSFPLNQPSVVPTSSSYSKFDAGESQTYQTKPTSSKAKLEIDPVKLKEWLRELFLKYTGKEGDPSSFNYLFNSVLSSQYSLNEAEWAIKFSKEAKKFASDEKERKEKEDQARFQQSSQFVTELYRVYRQITFTGQNDDPILLQ